MCFHDTCSAHRCAIAICFRVSIFCIVQYIVLFGSSSWFWFSFPFLLPQHIEFHTHVPHIPSCKSNADPSTFFQGPHHNLTWFFSRETKQIPIRSERSITGNRRFHFHFLILFLALSDESYIDTERYARKEEEKTQSTKNQGCWVTKRGEDHPIKRSAKTKESQTISQRFLLTDW